MARIFPLPRLIIRSNGRWWTYDIVIKVLNLKTRLCISYTSPHLQGLKSKINLFPDLNGTDSGVGVEKICK